MGVRLVTLVLRVLEGLFVTAWVKSLSLSAAWCLLCQQSVNGSMQIGLHEPSCLNFMCILVEEDSLFSIRWLWVLIVVLSW